MQSRNRSLAFIPRMAWRDSRSSRRRLLLFSISISLGVAALIAILSEATKVGGLTDAVWVYGKRLVAGWVAC